MFFGKRVKKLTFSDEKRIIKRTFIIFSILQFIILVVLSVLTITYLQKVNFSFFFEVDLVTLVMSIILLSAIILIVAISSAITNAMSLWVIFHFFTLILLVAELVISIFYSDTKKLTNAAKSSWDLSTDQERRDTQYNLHCCGFSTLDEACKNFSTITCEDKLHDIIGSLRNVASIALFVCFVFSMFVDFVSCAICLYPDMYTVNDRGEEALFVEAPPPSQARKFRLYT